MAESAEDIYVGGKYGGLRVIGGNCLGAGTAGLCLCNLRDVSISGGDPIIERKLKIVIKFTGSDSIISFSLCLYEEKRLGVLSSSILLLLFTSQILLPPLPSSLSHKQSSPLEGLLFLSYTSSFVQPSPSCLCSPPPLVVAASLLCCMSPEGKGFWLSHQTKRKGESPSSSLAGYPSLFQISHHHVSTGETKWCDADCPGRWW